MKRIVVVIVCTLLLGGIQAQVNQDFEKYRQERMKAFADYKDAKQKAFAEYREKINREFAEKMGRQWKQEKTSKPVPVPKRPEPPKPVIKEKPTPVPTQAEPVAKVVPPVKEEPQPQPVQPIAHPVNEDNAAYTFNFHNTPCKVHLKKEMSFSLANAKENTVSAAWQKLSKSGYDVVADDCLNYRKQLLLNDWGFIDLVKTLANAFLGKNSNESVLMQGYLLAQAGYKIRMARSGEKLVLLVPFTNVVYEYTYLMLDGEKFYVLEENKNSNASYFVFNEKFPGEKTPSLVLKNEPLFKDDPTPTKAFASVRYPEIAVNITTNKNWIEFYNSCPSTDWEEYAKASLSNKVKKTLYPVLKKQIAGKSQVEAANILLNFVQTAFKYKTDDEQFGYERSLFGDELFYYPYSDCEDRSILFSILVKDLLNLDVVLLNYPEHLATAVCFTENVSGHYFTIKNKKYVVCDPTYIGAPVGDCMPQFAGVGATIIEIEK